MHGLRPVVDRIFPFSELPAALEYMESGKHFGKIALSCLSGSRSQFWRIPMATSAAAADSQDHLARIRQELKNVAGHAREQVRHVASPQARALFETTAEVLDGAYEHAAQRSEPAWQ